MVHDTPLPWCSYLDEEAEPSIVAMANVQHLATRLDGASPQAARNREAFGRLRSTLSVHLGIED